MALHWNMTSKGEKEMRIHDQSAIPLKYTRPIQESARPRYGRFGVLACS